MPLREDQIKSVKTQLLKQVQNFPEDKRQQAEDYINAMNAEQLEEFLLKNKLVKNPEPSELNQSKESKCIYCNLANKLLDSLPLYEDKDYLCVLEINPYSRGHSILIPKQHVKDAKSLKARAFATARKIGKFVIRKLKAEDFQITTSDDLGHAIVNIIPVYKEPLTYERKKIEKGELQDLAMKIGKLEKKSAVKKPKPAKVELAKEKITPSIIRLPRRIP